MNLMLHKHAQEVRDMWQSRALAAAEGALARVLLAIFAEAYPTALKTLLLVTFPGFVDIQRPFLRGYATIVPSGRVVCDMVCTDGTVRKETVYESQEKFIYDARKLADKLKLADKDRVEMFGLLSKWISSDMRIGVNGQRLVS